MIEIDDIEIGTLGPEKWRYYRDLWLEALQETPEAFLASYDYELKTPDEKWQRRLQKVRDEKEQMMVFALNQGKPVGMIGVFFQENPKVKHIADIWTAYVLKEYRRAGVAKKMLTALLDRIQARPEITKVKIGSITNQKLIVNLYKDYGFELIGIYKNEIKVGDKYYDEYLMEKMIR